jgi:roadblock/LC7 domain-containing protein
MLKRLLAIDGVMAVCRFRDDGVLVEGYGVVDDALLPKLAAFAHDYKRLIQGNADQLSMFTQSPGWTPPAGWFVKGQVLSVVSVANLVCVIDHRESGLDEVMTALKEASSW